MRALDLLRQRRVQVVAGCAVVAILVIALAMTRGGDDEQLVSLEGTSTTSSSTSTTEPTTTTVATTTSTAAPTTTMAPSTTSPPPPVPTTTAPASLDRMAVLSYAKAHRPDVAPPYTHSGSTCEVGSGTQHDEGDDTDGDILRADLIRDCSGNFRLFLRSPTEIPTWDWIEIDAGSGGCESVDLVAVIWPGGSSTLGAVVATPSCDPGSWSSPGTAGNAYFPGIHIDFSGSPFGDPTSFEWRAGLLGSSGDTTIDLVPNTGFASFQR